jgi:hypothetical protein
VELADTAAFVAAVEQERMGSRVIVAAKSKTNVIKLLKAIFSLKILGVLTILKLCAKFSPIRQKGILCNKN